MHKRETSKSKSSSTNTTHIGSVTGQVHTGSGNIVVKNFSSGAVSTKEDFLAALQAFKIDLKAAQKHGLPDLAVDEVITELEAAEREAKLELPNAEQITNKLEKAKSLIVAGTTLAAAADQAVPVVHKLVQLIENGIHAVGPIFR